MDCGLQIKGSLDHGPWVKNHGHWIVDHGLWGQGCLKRQGGKAPKRTYISFPLVWINRLIQFKHN